MKVSVKKPGSPSEILEHSGVKGMKWGVQRAVTKSRAFKSFSKASEANVQRHFARKSARTARKQAKAPQKGIAPGRASREFRAQNPTGKLQAKAINNARKESRAREKAIRKEKDSVEKARLLRDHMNNPGTAIALRTTRGEKLLSGIIAGAFLAGSKPGGVGRAVPTYTTAFAIGSTAQRRRIERTQRKGGFK